MAIQNIDDYSQMWANGVNIGELWDKIKAGFVGGKWDQSTIIPSADLNDWRVQARANLGLGNLAENALWIGASGSTVAQQATSALGRALLNSSIAADKIWYASAADTLTAIDISGIGRATLNAQSNAAVSQLWATKATQDSRGYDITQNYAHSLVLGTNTLTLYDNRATAQALSIIPVNTENGLLKLDETAKVPLVHIPDSILGQMIFAGTVDEFIDHSSASPSTSYDLVKVTLTNNAATKLHEKISAITISNKVVYLTTESTSGTYNGKPKVSYVDCEGVYFLWTSNAIVSGSAQMWSGERFQVGDWLVSVGGITAAQNDDGWRKIDNTDAVTGVKGSNENVYRIDNVSIDALDVRALATYDTTNVTGVNGLQYVADEVQFGKNIWAIRGVAAKGMADMDLIEAGGGTVTGVMFKSDVPYAKDSAYTPETGETIIRLPAYPERVTVQTDGLMSYQDKVKLNGIEDNATRVVESTVSGWGFTKNVGTVTSVGVSVPTGLSVSNSPITVSGTIAISLASGYTIPLTADVNKGVTAYGWGNHANAGYANATDVDAAVNTLASSIGVLQGSLGSMAYREADEFATAYDLGVAQNDIVELQGYFTSGSANTAVKLLTPRAINGTNFDGSADITTAKWGTARTITIKDNDETNSQANTSIDGSANFTLKLPATIKASLTGKADTAGKLHSSVDIKIASSDGSGEGTAVAFDGSANKTFLLPSTIKASLTGNASSASKLSDNTAYTAWGQKFFENGVPVNASGDMSSVGNIAFSASGKNIGGVAYFDTTSNAKKLGVNKSNPAYTLDVNGTVNASSNTTIGGTLGVTGAVTMDSSLLVKGNTTLGDNASDTVTITGDTSIGGALSVTSNLSVNGNTTLGNQNTDTVTINGVTTINNTLNVKGAVDFDSTLNVDGDTTLNNLSVNGNTVLGDQQGHNTLYINSTTTVNGTSLFTNNVTIKKGTSSTTPLTIATSYSASDNANLAAIAFEKNDGSSLGYIGCRIVSDVKEPYFAKGVGQYHTIWHKGIAGTLTTDWSAKDIYAANNIQSTAGNIEALGGGVAAAGIVDMAYISGGISGDILRDWLNYSTEESQILGSNLGIKGVRKSGTTYTFYGGDDLERFHFTLEASNIPNINLTQVNNTENLQAIETIGLAPNTTGFLKKTGANEWALATDVVTLTATQALTNKTYNGYTLAAACAKGIDTSLPATPTNNNVPTTKLVADTYLPKTGGLIDGSSAFPLQVSGNTVMAGITYYASDNTTVFGTIGANADGPLFRGSDNTSKKIWHEGNMGGLFTSLTSNSTNAVSVTVGGVTKNITAATMRTSLGLGSVYSHAHTDYVTDIDTSDKQLTWAKGGVAQTAITIPFATEAAKMETEVKAGQEFTFRNSPKTIDADSMKLDRILGKTLVWNQKCGGKPTTGGSELSYDSTTGIFTLNGSINTWQDQRIQGAGVPGHKIYTKYVYVSGSTTGTCEISEGFSAFNLTMGTSDVSAVATWPSQRVYSYYGIKATSGTVANNLKFKVESIDLTLLYSGEDISGLTNSQLLAKFERDYFGYHSFNAGQLINNATKAIESVGFNLWDEEWEEGIYNNENGNPAQFTNALRCKNLIKVLPNTDYYVSKSDARILFYDANKHFVKWGGSIGNTFTTESNAYYVAFYFTNYGTTYNNDICINLSDSAKNGTYEPYKKVVTNLNLNDFWVKDSQGNLVHITGGLKSVGDVCDEIVNGKLIRKIGDVDLGTLTWDYDQNSQFTSAVTGLRPWTSPDPLGKGLLCAKYKSTSATLWTSMVSGEMGASGATTFRIKDTAYNDATAFKTAMSGVMLYYELAVPETYELVNPIPTAMFSGTTERRLPDDTASSVTAPFAADITYGTQNGDVLMSAIPWERVSGRPTIEKGSLSDAEISSVTGNGEYFKVNIGDVSLYIKFVVGDSAFKLQIADNDSSPTLTKEFEFATLSAADIDAICV